MAKMTYTEQRKEIRSLYHYLYKKKYTKEDYPNTLKCERKMLAKEEAIKRVRGVD